jgi:Flp pilus assembly protein TadB
VRATWAIIAGLALGVAVALWLSRESPRSARMKQVRAEQAAAANARDAMPSLYRWRDARGVLQVTDKPPRGVRYERIGQRPRDGIEVRGDRR